MSVNEVNKQTGDTSRIAGGTLYADAPIGAILAFGGSSAPAGWLLCQGQAISRTTYAALFAVIGTAYGAGDGSTTFNLPDPREAALIGAGTNVLNAGSIAAHNAVNLGAFQDDQFQTHAHHVYINNDPNHPVLSNKNLKANGEDYWNVNPSGRYPIVASTEFEGNRAGTTTHGKQLGVNYIIKAQQVALPADFATELDKKQNITDNTLQTDSKTVPGAINEINSDLTISKIAESLTTGTLSAKIDSLYSAFTALSQNKKERARLKIVLGNEIQEVININAITPNNAIFSITASSASGLSSAAIDMKNSGSIYGAGSISSAGAYSFNDYSSIQNAQKIELWA